jgi:hypothetical protein
MDSTSGDILTPKALIVPNVSGAHLITYAPIGSLVMSGAKLYVAVSTGTFELVTSA